MPQSPSVMCLAAECWTYSGVKWRGKKRRFYSAAAKAKIILSCVFWVKNSRNLSLEMCHVLNHLEVATATDSCSQTWAGTVGTAMKSFLLLSLLCKKLSCGLGQGFHSGSPSSRLINLLINQAFSWSWCEFTVHLFFGYPLIIFQMLFLMKVMVGFI